MECRPAKAAAAGFAGDVIEEVTYQIGGRVSAPKILYKVEPTYTEKARKAKFQGTVVFSAQIDTAGHAIRMRVLRPLGLGLDEKAMAAINQWRFKPGALDGKPVSTNATIEVNFRLL